MRALSVTAWVGGRIFVAMAIVTLGAAGAATGATSKDPKYGKIRVGPVYLTPRLTVTAGVDNNVYNTPAGVADQSVAVIPGLDAVIPVTRHARIRASGGIAPHYFDKEASQRFTDVFGTAGAEADAGPLTVRAGRGAGHYRERFSLEIDDRLLRHESSDYFGATVHVLRRFSADVAQTDLTSTYDQTATLAGQSVSGSLDRKTITRTVTLTIPLTRKTSLLPFADFIEDRFLLPELGVPRTVDSQRFGASFQFSELAFLQGRIGAGIRRFAAGQGVAPYTGPFLLGDLDLPFLFGTRLALVLRRDVNFTVTPAATPEAQRNTAVTATYRADWRFELPWRLQGRVFGGYSESRYLSPVLIDGTVRPRLDHFWTEGATLLRHLGRHVSLGGIVQAGKRVSPLDGHSYDGALYGLTGDVHF